MNLLGCDFQLAIVALGVGASSTFFCSYRAFDLTFVELERVVYQNVLPLPAICFVASSYAQ